jgi:hypothetical protein
MKQKNQLHLPPVKFSSIQNGVTYSFIKIFNKLPLNIKISLRLITFKAALRKFLVKNTFYSIDGFSSINCDVK